VIVTTYPRSVRVIEHVLIPLKDGTTLAARMWLPDDAERNPVPAYWNICHTVSATVHTNGTR
jgi:uncharacterized protein